MESSQQQRKQRWSLPKITLWDKIIVVLFLALLATLWFVPPSSGLRGPARILLRLATYFTGALVLGRIIIYLFRRHVGRFLWRVRNRMVAVYVFVGLIPLLLALTLAALGLWLASGPLAAYMTVSRIEQRAASLQATAASLGWHLRAKPAPERRAAVDAFLRDVERTFPGVMVRFDLPGVSFGRPPPLANHPLPESLRRFQGVVDWRGTLALGAYAQDAPESVSIVLLVPLTPEYLQTLLPSLGPLELWRPPQGDGEPRPRGLGRRRFQQLARLLPPPVHPFDYAIPWVVEVPVLSWETGETARRPNLRLVTRPSAVARALFGSQSMQSSDTLIFASGVLGLLFGTALLVSLVVAVSLTRTLTRAVHELHLGTELINLGDFSHRIPIRGNDQLGALAHSFNSMAASIETLIEESKEHQRLQSEIEIAREVQSHLFPRQVPALKSLEVLGVCRPAQSVSGDFYDYVDLSPTRLALAFGDVSGKGISAALVMATLHSLVRTHLSFLAHLQNENETLQSTAEVVVQVNRQLHLSTSANKFATLLFGTYDEERNALVYSNAGHLPPLLVRANQVTRLDVHGLVVGAFPQSRYSSTLVRLEAGDLIVAFTDGITEPENAYGDEFGEGRLAEIVLRKADRPAGEIIDAVMEEIDVWTGSPVLQDDRTMLVLRRR